MPARTALTFICFPRRSNYAFPGIVGIISAVACGNAPQNRGKISLIFTYLQIGTNIWTN